MNLYILSTKASVYTVNLSYRANRPNRSWRKNVFTVVAVSLEAVVHEVLKTAHEKEWPEVDIHSINKLSGSDTEVLIAESSWVQVQ